MLLFLIKMLILTFDLPNNYKYDNVNLCKNYKLKR